MLSFKLLAAFAISICLTDARVADIARSGSSLCQFYTYGANISGLPLFVGDGTAYIGSSRPPSISNVINVTLSDHDSTIVATSTNSTLRTPSVKTQKLYIDNTQGAFSPVGLTSASSNSTRTTGGFRTFGTLLVWANDKGDLQSKWYAAPTEADGVYILKWNVDSVATGSAVSVVLKNIAPGS